MPGLKILHTNDLHGRLTPSKLPALKSARSECDLYFDTGDCIKAGNLAIPLGPDPVWGYLQEAQITASVPGNRESHVLESVVDAKFRGFTHPVLCANWRSKTGVLKFSETHILECRGRTIGLFGVMVAMVTNRMSTRVGSQFLWDPPIATAVRVAEELRSQCDVVIALTHIGYTQDVKLAEATDAIDVIFGGHSHTVLETPVQIGRTWIAQGGSHARFMGRYELDSEGLRGGLDAWEEMRSQ